MFTLKIYEGEDGTFKNPDDAIKYAVDTNFENEVSVYDVNPDRAYEKTCKIYKAIKEYNKSKPLDDQILPSNPFGFRGILGCLGVQVYTVGLGTYKVNRECIALFTGYNQSVLDTSIEKVNIGPGSNAMTSLTMIGSTYIR